MISFEKVDDLARVFVTIFEQLIPISGGGTPRIRNIIDAFIKRNHRVVVAAPLSVDVDEAQEILKCNKVIPLRNVSRLDRKKMVKYLLLHPVNISKVVCEATRERPDLTIAHNSIAGFADLLTRKLIDCISVVDMTDLLFEYLQTYHEYASWISTIYAFGRRMECKVIREANKIITISNAMREVLLHEGAVQEKIDIVYDGVRSDIFKPCKEEAAIIRGKYARGLENVVMHHGVFDPQDRPEILVDAARIVLQEHPSTMFWLIGDGAAIPRIKEKAKRKGVQGHFFFSGWIPFVEVPSFLSACDVGLVILPNTLSAGVRITLKGFEYWACEKPIIVPELPALKEIVSIGKTGLFYEPENPMDLARKICTLLEDKQLSKNMGKAGRELVEREYSWDKLANEFVSICEGIL